MENLKQNILDQVTEEAKEHDFTGSYSYNCIQDGEDVWCDGLEGPVENLESETGYTFYLEFDKNKFSPTSVWMVLDFMRSNKEAIIFEASVQVSHSSCGPCLPSREEINVSGRITELSKISIGKSEWFSLEIKLEIEDLRLAVLKYENSKVSK